ncbi:MAG: type III secretion system effector protein [Rikenellaceae bacterium]|nr:type III secretion system effector protein [Rikenellaceae bacterium]
MTEHELDVDHKLQITDDKTGNLWEMDMQTGSVATYDKDGVLIAEKQLNSREMARWLTLDRFAEKYYSMSPYSFAAGNPVRYIDINGDSLWIAHKGVELLYVDGQLYNRDGSAYEGKTNRFIDKAIAALGTAASTNTGGGMISSLQNSENNFTIVKGPNQFTPSNFVKAYGEQHRSDNTAAYQMLPASDFMGGSGGTISWKPSGASVPTLNGYSNNPAVVLGHEISHAFDANAGRMNQTEINGLSSNEWQAVYRENQMRSELGLPLRTHYGSAATAEGVKLHGLGPRLLTPANQPYMPWNR